MQIIYTKIGPLKYSSDTEELDKIYGLLKLC